MNFYTEDQVKQILSNSIDQTMGFAENGGVMNKEAAQAIISRSFVHPSTFEIQKQIEAVRGLIEAYDDLGMTNIEHTGTKVIIERIGALHEPLKNLTETLKPYLNGEKLEM